MLSEALTALAAAGGSAVVQAAGTDAWAGVRRRTARMFGRTEEQDVLDALDRTADELAHGGPGEEAAAQWAELFARRLSGLDEQARSALADQLRELASASSPAPSAGPVFHGDVTVRADQGVAGAVINGSVHLENPRSPGRDQG